MTRQSACYIEIYKTGKYYDSLDGFQWQTVNGRLQENYGLKYVNLAMNGLADDGAKLIGEALKFNQCLVDLNISSNRITAEGASDIARGIEVNESLQTLRVRMNTNIDVIA